MRLVTMGKLVVLLTAWVNLKAGTVKEETVQLLLNVNQYVEMDFKEAMKHAMTVKTMILAVTQPALAFLRISTVLNSQLKNQLFAVQHKQNLLLDLNTALMRKLSIKQMVFQRMQKHSLQQ